MGSSSDTVFYDNTFGIAGRCAVLSLDGNAIANDTMHTSGCATGSPGPATETDNISAGTVFGTGSADSMTGSNAAEEFIGQGGNDRLLGGPGTDELHGSSGDDLLDGGGSGDDLFAEGDGATMIGGAGADDFFGSATGGGTVSYIDKTAPVSATLDGAANDGLVDDGIAPGDQSEGDNIDDNVITVIGGSGADELSAVDSTAAPGTTRSRAARATTG
jgi:Ca2+-binding RTX toxin-like protein